MNAAEGSVADFDGDDRPDLAVSNLDDNFDGQRTGDVVVLVWDGGGSFPLPLERIAAERAVSRGATGEVSGDGRAAVIVAHRESDCVAGLQCRGGGRVDQLVGSRESPRA